jgi:hypothetical protein
MGRTVNNVALKIRKGKYSQLAHASEVRLADDENLNKKRANNNSRTLVERLCCDCLFSADKIAAISVPNTTSQ